MVRRYVVVKQHIAINSANLRNAQKLRAKIYDDKKTFYAISRHFILSMFLEPYDSKSKYQITYIKLFGLSLLIFSFSPKTFKCCSNKYVTI